MPGAGGGAGAPAERAPNDAKDLASHRGGFRLPPCISGLDALSTANSQTRKVASPCIRVEVIPGNAQGRRARASGRLHLASADHKKTQ